MGDSPSDGDVTTYVTHGYKWLKTVTEEFLENHLSPREHIKLLHRVLFETHNTAMREIAMINFDAVWNVEKADDCWVLQTAICSVICDQEWSCF